MICLDHEVERWKFAVSNFGILCSLFMSWVYMQIFCSNSCWILGDLWRQKFLQIKLYSTIPQLTYPRGLPALYSHGLILLSSCMNIPQICFIVEVYITEWVSAHNNQCSKSVSLNNHFNFWFPSLSGIYFCLMLLTGKHYSVFSWKDYTSMLNDE